MGLCGFVVFGEEGSGGEGCLGVCGFYFFCDFDYIFFCSVSFRLVAVFFVDLFCILVMWARILFFSFCSCVCIFFR